MKLIGFAGRWPEPNNHETLGRYAASVARQTPLNGHNDCFAPRMHTEDDITIAVRGRPSAPPVEILKAYRDKGTGLLEHLTGSFALAVIDRSSPLVLLALDRMGIERLAYSASANGIVFSTSAEAVASCPAVAAPLRPQALFDYLLLHMVPAPETVFENVKKLRAGTYALFKDSRVTTDRYWVPRFAEKKRESFANLKMELRNCLSRAIADCRPTIRTGAFLSGGLDSTTVAGLLGAVTGRAPRTFSIGFGVDDYDELAYADIANHHFGAIATRYHVTADDVVSAFQSIAAAFDEPFGNSSAVPTYFCAKLAADNGVTHLLAGDGGDEIFAGNERYARQRIFEAYGVIPRSLRKRIIEPLTERLSPEIGFTPLRKLRSYVDQARIPIPERLESWNFIYRTDLDAMLDPDFRASIDTRSPLRTMAEVFAAAPGHSLLDRMLFYDWQYTLSDNDLRKVGVMCELAGITVSYPMLDQRVVDLSLRVPAAMKMKGLRLRSFYKQAMRDFLPPEIIAKRKHGFGLPFGIWLKTDHGLAELVYGLLSDLKRRGIVRARFLDDLIGQHRTGHASYYGYAIWDLAILEAWLQARGAINRHRAAGLDLPRDPRGVHAQIPGPASADHAR